MAERTIENRLAMGYYNTNHEREWSLFKQKNWKKQIKSKYSFIITFIHSFIYILKSKVSNTIMYIIRLDGVSYTTIYQGGKAC